MADHKPLNIIANASGFTVLLQENIENLEVLAFSIQCLYLAIKRSITLVYMIGKFC